MLATGRRFQLERDAFAFPNELVWEYHFDPAAAATVFRRRVPPPDYVHRCFVLVRAARQFLYHARFDPAAPRASDAAYRGMIRAVLDRDPRQPPSVDRVVVPGFTGLREFSQERTALLKEECGGAWRSYVMRSHWRIVVPVMRRHQHRTAARLLDEVEDGSAPIIHLLRFPSLAINHGMVLFDGARTGDGVEFLAYDPNTPERPALLTYERERRTFSMASNRYWRGGDLNVFEIFRRWYL
jgi:hypothetical protein